jgi:hypothetical protein
MIRSSSEWKTRSNQEIAALEPYRVPGRVGRTGPRVNVAAARVRAWMC